MPEIVCSLCSEEKPDSEYYDHPAGKNGKLNRCKPCHRASMKRRREERADYYRDYEKHRAMQPHRVAQRLAYQQTTPGIIAGKRAKKKWIEQNPVKRDAQKKLSNAVRDKKIDKSKCCENCGAGGRIHGHHDDYAKPLDVRWLCPACHSAWHKENGEAKNGRAA